MKHVEHPEDVLDMMRALGTNLSESDKESLGKMSLRGRRFTLAVMLSYNLPIYTARPLILMGVGYSDPFWDDPSTSTLLKSPKTLSMFPPTLANLYISGRLKLKWPQDLCAAYNNYDEVAVPPESEGAASDDPSSPMDLFLTKRYFTRDALDYINNLPPPSFPMELLLAERYFTRDALDYINNLPPGVARFIVAAALPNAYDMVIVDLGVEWVKKQHEKYNHEVFWVYPCSASLRMSPETLKMFDTLVQELISNNELELKWPEDFTGAINYEDLAHRALYRLLVVLPDEKRTVRSSGHEGVLHILRMLRSTDEGVVRKAHKIVKLLQCAINTGVYVVIDHNISNKSPEEIIGYICDSFRCME